MYAVEVPGLAHFLEHMLFLGTAKYPDEAEYAAFLGAHGGSSNAYTANEQTNYHFDVQHQHLAPALDRYVRELCLHIWGCGVLELMGTVWTNTLFG